MATFPEPFYEMNRLMSIEETPPKLYKGHCPQCGPDRKADVVGYKRHARSDPDYWDVTEYAILQCRGCEEVYVRRQWAGEELAGTEAEVSYWPIPQRRRPEWMVNVIVFDHSLYSLFVDVYTAVDHKLVVLAAIGVRTTFDWASQLIGVDPAKNFKDKLSELYERGKISGDERASLGALTDASSAAAHRGWRPTPKELDEMIGILEHFLYQQIVTPQAAKRLIKSAPKRKRSELLKPVSEEDVGPPEAHKKH